MSGHLVAWPDGDAYFIDNIGVEPGYQGARLGRRLIDHAAAEADRLRLRALRLYTNVVMVETCLCTGASVSSKCIVSLKKASNRIDMRRSLAKGEESIFAARAAARGQSESTPGSIVWGDGPLGTRRRDIVVALKSPCQMADEGIYGRQRRSCFSIDGDDWQAPETLPIRQNLYQGARSQLVFHMTGKEPHEPTTC